MRAYILSVIGAVFLLDMTALIIPQGKTGKLICGIVRLCGVLVMLLPIVSLISDARYSLSEDGGVQTDEEYLNKSLAMRIESYIDDSYGVECGVKKLDRVITVYADKALFPDGFEEAIKAAFGEDFIIVYEY